MSGVIFTIVGPSGAGKDTLMEAARERLPDLHLVRRVITRPETAGGEAFEGVGETEFKRRLENGDFALHWVAHGLSYGIPASVQDVLNAGGTVLFNGSRAMLHKAAEVFPQLKVIHLNARDDVLAKRLAERGRETTAQIAARLERAKLSLPSGLNVIEIDNSGALDTAIAELTRALSMAKVPA